MVRLLYVIFVCFYAGVFVSWLNDKQGDGHEMCRNGIGESCCNARSWNTPPWDQLVQKAETSPYRQLLWEHTRHKELVNIHGIHGRGKGFTSFLFFIIIFLYIYIFTIKYLLSTLQLVNTIGGWSQCPPIRSACF